MQKKSSKNLFNYWNELRGSRSAPDRRNIDPTKIRASLANTFILEAVEEEFNFRLVGSHIYSAYCRELKKRPFAQLWSKKDNEAIETLIRAVTEDHAVAVATFIGKTETGAQTSFEIVLLPLHHNGNTSSRVLGALSALDEPYWLGSQPIVEQRITGLRLIWPDDVELKEKDNAFKKSNKPDVTWDVSSNMSKDKPSVNRPNITQITRQVPIPASVHGNSARRYAHLAVIDGGKS